MHFLAVVLAGIFASERAAAQNVAGVVPASQHKESFREHTIQSIKTMQHWYNSSLGYWPSAGWWNSANVLTMLANFDAIDPTLNLTIGKIYENTFKRAQEHQPFVTKTRIGNFTDSATSWELPKRSQVPMSTASEVSRGRGFLNDFYDDEGWWALAWLKVYDNTNDPRYLETAERIFKDMIGGYNATCGGIWWNKAHDANAAISNTLFLAVAAQLASRTPSNRSYREWAFRQWDWFSRSGLIDENYNIIDGINLTDCRPQKGAIFTYTHGVMVGALVELAKISHNKTMVDTAQKIATAGIQYFSDNNGILHEPCEPNCGMDGPQFKGIFMRNLQSLQLAYPDSPFTTFVEANAHSIWTRDRNATTDELGLIWSGPFKDATGGTHSSASDALVAAAALELSSQRLSAVK